MYTVHLQHNNATVPLEKSYEMLYQFFLDADIQIAEKQKIADDFLAQKIKNIEIDVDFPQELSGLLPSVEQQHHDTCQAFQTYLAQRQAGAKRQYFPHLSAVYLFLLKVAPVKLVDGSWLYGLVRHWEKAQYHDGIITYLEELGLGEAKGNHVCMYQQLLQQYGLHDTAYILTDDFYEQAVVQLALGYASDTYLPEIIGFNLGYEQLPLHLMISNYELNELGIDAQYFNVHITIDNLHSGHAKRAIQAVKNMVGHDLTRWERIKKGYALNNMGWSSTQMIKQFDLDETMIEMLRQKARVGQFVHQNKCQFAGQTINQWLSQPEKMAEFLNELQQRKWLIRGQAADQSPFWRMIIDPNGKMFGVFNHFEKQIISDWIQGDQVSSSKSLTTKPHFHHSTALQQLSLNLQESLRNLSLKEKIEQMIPLLSPAQHFTQNGLAATQLYTQILFPYLAPKFDG